MPEAAGRYWVRRNEGLTFITLSLGRPVLPDDQDENCLLDFELHDNGGARIFMSRLIDTSRDGSGSAIVLDGAALDYACRIVRVAQFVSAEISCRGAWGFGIRGDGLAGAVSNAIIAQRDYFFVSDADPYETDQDKAVTTAHPQEIQDSPATIADRLVARLLHGLGSYDVLDLR